MHLSTLIWQDPNGSAETLCHPGDLQTRIYSLSAQLAKTKQDRDDMASAMDAAGLARGAGHASSTSLPGAKPAWDRRTRQPALSRHQSAFPGGDNAHGRSSLQHQASAVAPDRSHVSFAQQHGSAVGGLPHDHQQGHARSRLAEQHSGLGPSMSSAAGYAASGALMSPEASLKLASQPSTSYALPSSSRQRASAGPALRSQKSHGASSPARSRQLIDNYNQSSGQFGRHASTGSQPAIKPGTVARSSGSLLSAQAPADAGLYSMQSSAVGSPTMLDLLQPAASHEDVSLWKGALHCACQMLHMT